MKKKCNVVMLPAKKQVNQVNQGDLFINDTREHSWGTFQALRCERVTKFGHAWVGHGIQTYINHLYITSDDEIKEGDWCYIISTTEIRRNLHGIIGSTIGSKLFLEKNCKKIIATTDKLEYKLIRTLPQIPESFIKEYVKNPVDEVMVEYDQCNLADDYWLELGLINNEIIISPVEEKMYTKKQVINIVWQAIKDGVDDRDDMDTWFNKNL